MALEILSRYLHFLGIFTMFAALVAEHLLLAPSVSKALMRRISVVDGIYGAGAVIALTFGLILWFGTGKPAAFYTQNWVFHIKLTLFVVLVLLSVYPTVFFIRRAKSEAETIAVPKLIIMLVRMELLILVLMPLTASIMAKGIGFFG